MPDDASIGDAQPIDEGEYRPALLRFATVAIGASAGGVQALVRLFGAMPEDPGCAFIVMMHLAPARESMLPEVIARATTMKVVAATDGVKLRANQVYVCPPGHYTLVRDGRLRLEPMGNRPPAPKVIDRLMSSLASDQQGHAIGIVLTGVDRDGSLGVKAIKSEGGLTIAQLPESASHPGMPQNAVATGLIDRQLEIEDMPEVIVEFARAGNSGGSAVDGSEPAPDELLPRALELVRAKSGLDFRGYKKPMLLRRLRRRMALCRIASEAGYLKHLMTTPAEVQSLASDLLISVTEFFREPQSWAALTEEVMPRLLESKDTGDKLRIWVPGCATGEEAYSIAMVFLEHPLVAQRRLQLQLFATDVDKTALQVGRQGLYPRTIEHSVGAGRLRRFFTRHDGGYQVSKELRDVLMFAAHNITADPPFSRIDLISCRNLLIYMETQLQRRVLRTFHFALKPDGILALGKSESAGTPGELFVPISQRARIFRRIGPARVTPYPLPLLPLERTDETVRPPTNIAREPDYAQLMRSALRERRIAAAMLADRDGRVLYFYGTIQPYLGPTEGAPTSDVFALLRSELRVRLATLLRRAVADARAEGVATLRDEGADKYEVVQLTVSRMPGASHVYLITFDLLSASEHPPQEEPGDENGQALNALHHELRNMRHELRGTIEQLESANEELKVANEETMSMNEELQSSNEELETSKEELQSMNEELTSLNSQLHEKVSELERTNDDLSNLLSSTHIPTLFLDRKLRIKRFTPAATRLFRLIPGDVDRPLTDLASVDDIPSLLDDARRVLEMLAPIERETHTADGKFFLRRTLTYRTRDDRIEGVVVTFTDISELRAAAQELRRYGAVMQDSNDSVIVLDPAGRILAWNRGALAIYGRSAEEVLQTDLASLLPSGARDEFREHISRALAGERIVGVEVRRCMKDGVEIDVSATFSLVPGDGQAPPSVALIERDVSQRKQAETRLRESELRFRTMADDAPVLIWTAGREGMLEFVNREFARFVGRPETELLGSRLAALLHREDREHTVLLAPGATAVSERFDSLARLQAADGHWRWMKITAHRRAGDGGWVGSLIDVSDQVESERTLRAADQRKDEFLAMLGHELRNPLVPIRNAAEVLNRIADVTDSRIGWVRDTLVRQVAHVTRLVDDLLDISAVTRGSLKLHLEPADLRFLAERACASMSSNFERKHHRFECSLPDTPLWVQGDSVRLTQIVENLLSNAAKYTDEGGRIEMRLTREGNQAVLTVTDNGLGIDPSMLGRVFELFVQDERAIDRSEGGLGVGLALVRHFVELHSGRIEARSEGIGKGSEMIVRLPLIASGPPVEKPAEPTVSRGKGRILIVDDDRDVGESMRVLLQVYGFEAEHATDLPAALEAARRFRPQIALIDLAMPGADGIEVLGRLRLLPEMERAQYTSLSGFGAPKDFARSARAGFAHHLVKPVDPVKLIELFAKLLESQ